MLSKSACTGDLKSCTPFYRIVCSNSFVPLNYLTSQKPSQFTLTKASLQHLIRTSAAPDHIIRLMHRQVAGVRGSRYGEAGSLPQAGRRNLGIMSPLSERSLIFPLRISTMREPRQEPSAGPAPDPAPHRCEGSQMRDDRRDERSRAERRREEGAGRSASGGT